MKQYKIKDIAERSGVCAATVSRTLRQPELVSDATREKIMKVIDELNFRPSKLGASLRNGQSGAIVLIIPDITNPYFSALTRGVEKHAQSKGYTVVLGDTKEDPAVEEHFADMVLSRQADGIIICSQRVPYDVQRFSAGSGTLPPIVSTADVVDDESIHRVVVNNEQIGFDGIQYLLELGHKNIAIVAGSRYHRNSLDRLVGIRKAYAAAGQSFDESLIMYSDYTMQSGAANATELAAKKNRPTAIFCFGDLLAIGVIHALTKLGFNIPKDISVLGVDNISISQYTNPGLSTISQPTELIGERCMQILLQIINRDAPGTTLEHIPHELIIRESTAAPS